ncbi:MAG TPA: Maf family protein, partial [Planctomycetaceae bacterium]
LSDSCLLSPDSSFVLASRSPRRLELLALVVPRDRIRVVPPASPDEAGFDGLRTRRGIETRLLAIAAAKCDDVLSQLGGEAGRSIVIAADTVIVAGEADGELVPLGQPPEPDWRETTRGWFLDYYAGRTHLALTGLCVAGPRGRRETVVATRVAFRPDVAAYLDWYLATGEPRGKAGGYAIQGAGSLFVDRVEGSLTNVVGLPLRELLDVLRELGAVRRP